MRSMYEGILMLHYQAPDCGRLPSQSRFNKIIQSPSLLISLFELEEIPETLRLRSHSRTPELHKALIASVKGNLSPN